MTQYFWITINVVLIIIIVVGVHGSKFDEMSCGDKDLRALALAVEAPARLPSTSITREP
jgi:hypothetical protein